MGGCAWLGPGPEAGGKGAADADALHVGAGLVLRDDDAVAAVGTRERVTGQGEAGAARHQQTQDDHDPRIKLHRRLTSPPALL